MYQILFKLTNNRYLFPVKYSGFKTVFLFKKIKNFYIVKITTELLEKLDSIKGGLRGPIGSVPWSPIFLKLFL
jgi:hypothetical protein